MTAERCLNVGTNNGDKNACTKLQGPRVGLARLTVRADGSRSTAWCFDTAMKADEELDMVSFVTLQDDDDLIVSFAIADE